MGGDVMILDSAFGFQWVFGSLAVGRTVGFRELLSFSTFASSSLSLSTLGTLLAYNMHARMTFSYLELGIGWVYR
jgi:hypothetical protein